jgi:hypothetical protein
VEDDTLAIQFMGLIGCRRAEYGCLDAFTGKTRYDLVGKAYFKSCLDSYIETG